MAEQATTATGESRRTSNLVTAIAAAIAVVGSIVFIAETDSWYLAFKALHVVAAVLWIGGGALLTFLALATERADDPARLVAVARQAEWAAMRIFVPASFVVLGFGIAMMLNADLDWGAFWVSFGLLAWLVSTAIGIFYLTPKIKRLNALMDEHGALSPEVQRAIPPILLAARLDVALLLLIVVDMTVKPFS